MIRNTVGSDVFKVLTEDDTQLKFEEIKEYSEAKILKEHLESVKEELGKLIATIEIDGGDHDASERTHEEASEERQTMSMRDMREHLTHLQSLQFQIHRELCRIQHQCAHLPHRSFLMPSNVGANDQTTLSQSFLNYVPPSTSPPDNRLADIESVREEDNDDTPSLGHLAQSAVSQKDGLTVLTLTTFTKNQKSIILINDYF